MMGHNITGRAVYACGDVSFEEYLWAHMVPLVEVDPIIPPDEVASILERQRRDARADHPEYTPARVEYLARALFNGLIHSRVRRRLERNKAWLAMGLPFVWHDPLMPATGKALRRRNGL